MPDPRTRRGRSQVPLEDRWRLSDATEQLVIGSLRVPGMASQDRLEMLDATWEDSAGRLPHEAGYKQ